MHKFLDCGDKPERVQNARIKRVGEISNLVEHRAHVPARSGHFFHDLAHVVFGTGKVFRPFQRQPQRREGLAQVVMKLARDVAAFFVASAQSGADELGLRDGCFLHTREC